MEASGARIYFRILYSKKTGLWYYVVTMNAAWEMAMRTVSSFNFPRLTQFAHGGSWKAGLLLLLSIAACSACGCGRSCSPGREISVWAQPTDPDAAIISVRIRNETGHPIHLNLGLNTRAPFLVAGSVRALDENVMAEFVTFVSFKTRGLPLGPGEEVNRLLDLREYLEYSGEGSVLVDASILVLFSANSRNRSTSVPVTSQFVLH
jgi:hypothetical protein